MQALKLNSAARLWQSQLKQCCPVWTSAGIYPVSGRQDGQTWKELVVTASQNPAGVPDTIQAVLPMVSQQDEKRNQLWNSGTQYVQVFMQILHGLMQV